METKFKWEVCQYYNGLDHEINSMLYKDIGYLQKSIIKLFKNWQVSVNFDK